MANSRWVKLGQIGRPHGLSGHFYLTSESAPSLNGEISVRVGDDPSCGIPTTIKKISATHHGLILKLSGVEDRETLSQFQNEWVWIQSTLVSLAERIVGVGVIDSLGSKVGKVVAWENHGASDILTIQNSEGLYLDLPLVADYFQMETLAALESTDTTTITLSVAQTDLTDLWYET